MISVLLFTFVACAQASYYGFYFGGKFQGYCGPNGYYYVDSARFVQCSGGRPYHQQCPVGTENSPLKAYKLGYYLPKEIFCDVNLNDANIATHAPTDAPAVKMTSTEAAATPTENGGNNGDQGNEETEVKDETSDDKKNESSNSDSNNSNDDKSNSDNKGDTNGDASNHDDHSTHDHDSNGSTKWNNDDVDDAEQATEENSMEESSDEPPMLPFMPYFYQPYKSAGHVMPYYQPYKSSGHVMHPFQPYKSYVPRHYPGYKSYEPMAPHYKSSHPFVQYNPYYPFHNEDN